MENLPAVRDDENSSFFFSASLDTWRKAFTVVAVSFADDDDDDVDDGANLLLMSHTALEVLLVATC